jgi:hypothetical protein
MKLLVAFVCLIVAPFFNGPGIADDVIASLKQGKASEVVKFFDEKVSVKIKHQEDVLSRSQAEANLKYFFEKHPVKSFSATHKSSINNNSQYVTGTLETANGKFRVSILIRHSLVTQFRLEEDND